MNRSRWATVVLGFVILFLGCSSTSPASKTAFELAQSFYSACNLQDSTRLTACEARLADAKNHNAISQLEHEVLLQVLRQAKAGKWKRGMQIARDFMSQ